MPKIPYDKPHLEFAAQIALLRQRGLEIGNEMQAIACLRRIGYYGLSAYWYPFRAMNMLGQHGEARGDQFLPDHTFQQAVKLYEYDKALRSLLMDAIERIEISARVEIANHLGSRDPFAQNNPAILHPDFSRTKSKRPNDRSLYDDWKRSEQDHYWRSSERFAQHFATRYALPMPIWISIELWDFGMLSKFFAGMTVADQSHVSDYYGVPDWKVMQSWLRTLNHARNIAAHHSRLWNRNIDDQPKLPKLGSLPAFDHLIRYQPTATSRVYAILCIILHFLERIDPEEGWRDRLRTHIDVFPLIPDVGVGDMGFPKGWEQEHIWRPHTLSSNEKPRSRSAE